VQQGQTQQDQVEELRRRLAALTAGRGEGSGRADGGAAGDGRDGVVEGDEVPGGAARQDDVQHGAVESRDAEQDEVGADGDAGDGPRADAWSDLSEDVGEGRRAQRSTRNGGGRPGPGVRGGGRGRRRGRPATEPPEDGPAAVDAEPDHEKVARSVALRLLTAAPRSRAQLAEAMARRDVPEEVAERVLDRFTEVGLVDDAAYAEVLVRSRHAERGLSRRALAMELRKRGVDETTAAVALEQVDEGDEEQAARALARRRLAATRGLDRETRLRRAYAALGRKGYGGGLVSRVVREELAAEGADADEPWAGEPLG
jgi:SOS response regulatory protein OraA/RecX